MPDNNNHLDRHVLIAQLTQTIKEKGLRRFTKPVQLTSGPLTCDFVDGNLALSHWADLKVAAQAIYATATEEGHEFDAVGGLSLGANALTVAIASVAGCSWFFIRRTPKERGTRQQIEGAQIGPGYKVLLVDDVVATGEAIFLAYDIVAEVGAEIVATSTLIDRGEFTAPIFKNLNRPYYPMLTYDTLGIVPVQF